MQLKQIDIFGFKSFADKTRLDFASGVTAIVGPNGCGKSNISDAIRWVLGEQNPRHLRGAMMNDVIFKGNAKRKAYGMGEVSITFDNNRGVLPVEYNEINICRKVYTNGEGEYFVNNLPCRLKDITSMFYDTGMGYHSYSVIEQKMVDKILSHNADDKRYLFEEAAQIVKFKRKRKSTLDKINTTEGDLVRINDVINEVGSHVRSLAYQARKARQYKKLSDEKKNLELLLFYRKFLDILDSITPLTGRKEEVNNRITEKEAEKSKVAASLEKMNLEIMDSEKQLRESGRDFREEDTVIKKLEEDIAVGTINYQNQLDNVNRIEKNLDRYNEESEETRAKIAEIEKEIRTLTEQAEDIELILEDKEDKYDDYSASFTKNKELLDKIRKEISELNNGLNKKEARVFLLRDQYNNDRQHKKEMEEKISRSREEMAGLQQSIEEHKNRKEELSNKLADMEKEIETAESARKECLKKTAELQDIQNESIAELRKAIHQVEIYQALKENLEGYEEDTRKIIKKNKGLKPVGELIEFAESHTRMIESALYGYLQYIYSEENGQMDQALDFAIKNNLRAGFFYPGEPKTGEEMDIDGFIRLTELVESPGPDYFNAFLSMFYVQNEDMDFGHIISCSKKMPSHNFITKSGLLVHSGHIVVRERKLNAKASLTGRDRKINKYKAQKEKLETTIHRQTKELQELNQAERQTRQKIETLKEEIKKAKADIVKTDKDVLELEFKIKIAENTRSDVEKMIVQLDAKMKKDKDEMDVLEENCDYLSEILEEKENEMKKTRMDLADTEKMYLDYKTQIDQGRMEIRLLKTKIDNKRILEKENSKNLDKLTIAKETDTRSREKLLQESAELKKQLEAYRKELIEHSGNYDSIKKHLDEKEAIIQAKRAEIRQVEDTINKYNKALSEFHQEIYKIELEINSLDAKKDNLKSNLWEKYKMFPTELENQVQEPPESIDTEELGKQVADMSEKLGKLGTVNLLSIEEYEKENKRLTFLQSQKADLTETIDSLRKALNKIKKEAKEMFLATFASVRNNFRSLFKEIFEGGFSDIQLEDPDSPLDSKIIIKARPKGKKANNLSLLSGGERALVAICILFAIYMERPSPFCILDEVDAPLDDINTAKFLQLMKRFSGKTQFLVITHNKKTMEAADFLYGVTMEETGISKIVSVDLKKAVGAAAS